MIFKRGLSYFLGRIFLAAALAGTGYYMIQNIDNEDSYRYSIIRFNHYVAHNAFQFLNDYYLQAYFALAILHLLSAFLISFGIRFGGFLGFISAFLASYVLQNPFAYGRQVNVQEFDVLMVGTIKNLSIGIASLTILMTQ